MRSGEGGLGDLRPSEGEGGRERVGESGEVTNHYQSIRSGKGEGMNIWGQGVEEVDCPQVTVNIDRSLVVNEQVIPIIAADNYRYNFHNVQMYLYFADAWSMWMLKLFDTRL